MFSKRPSSILPRLHVKLVLATCEQLLGRCSPGTPVGWSPGLGHQSQGPRQQWPHPGPAPWSFLWGKILFNYFKLSTKVRSKQILLNRDQLCVFGNYLDACNY